MTLQLAAEKEERERAQVGGAGVRWRCCSTLPARWSGAWRRTLQQVCLAARCVPPPCTQPPTLLSTPTPPQNPKNSARWTT